MERYASDAMLRLLSDDVKFHTWREVWTAVAKLRNHFNLGVSADQLAEMISHLDDPIDYEMARQIEGRVKHDVIAHQQTFAALCPLIGDGMHDRLTSCDITDNADLIIIRQGLQLISEGTARSLHYWLKFAYDEADDPVMGYTHIKEASPVTVGKRVCGWIRDLLSVLMDLERITGGLKLRGIKGATGTQATFLELFGNDYGRLLEAEKFFAGELGFKDCYPITEQTYSRLVDVDFMAVLSKLAVVAERIGWNLRMWQHLNEVQEPFSEEQRGSSAMPWKKNPKDAERMCGIARFLKFMVLAASDTYAGQIFERTLDDSSCRRLFITEAFLAADSVLRILQHIGQSPIVHHDVIDYHLRQFVSLMASEHLLAAMVSAGQNRNVSYEKLQQHSFTAMEDIRQGRGNSFETLVRDDDHFAPISGQFDSLFDPSRYTGAAAIQTQTYLDGVVRPALEPYARVLDQRVDLQI